MIVEGAPLTVGVSVKFESDGASLKEGASLRDGASVTLPRLGAALRVGLPVKVGAILCVGTRVKLPDEGALLADGEEVVLPIEGAWLIDGASVPLLVVGEKLDEGLKVVLTVVGAVVTVGRVEGGCDVAAGIAELEGLTDVLEGEGARESSAFGDLVGRSKVGRSVGRGDGTAMGRDVMAKTVGLGLMFEGRIGDMGRMLMEVGVLIVGLMVVVGFLEGFMAVGRTVGVGGLIAVGRIARAAKTSAKYGRKKTVD